jgi:Protein of unknown function (DUF2961)/Bacterial alpha-L-rhamnosidase 6 hairpin glycosidase domain
MKRIIPKRIVCSSLGRVMVLLILLAIANEAVVASASFTTESNEFHFASPRFEVRVDAHAPGFDALNIDGLGLGKRGANVLREQTSSNADFVAAVSTVAGGKQVDYRRVDQATNMPPPWSIRANEDCLTFVSQWSAAGAPKPLSLTFDGRRCHATVLGILDSSGAVRLPALLHLPGQGSLQITAKGAKDATLGYTSARGGNVTVMFPAATAATPRIEYRLEATAIYPKLPGLADDRRFNSFRRNWLDVLQLNPQRRQLANNSGSTSCAFCYYEYGDIALRTPPLADGLTALDVVRQTLDSILNGAKAYGLPAPGNFPVESSDTLPSLLIASDDCVRGGGSDEWLATNYTKIKGWADKMLATDTNGDGLVKYIISGNSGIWPPGFPKVRPANWWDTIGFGHEDAYGNALAYRALGCMAHMAQQLGKSNDAARYRAAAKKLRAAYFKTFYDPATGVIGGWRSADGRLHDYYFLWVNGIAIDYGLVPRGKANAIMDKLMAKMKEVGYTNFHLGLPGNLITVALKDYVHRTPDGRFGGGVREDNADGFQKYENGGATGCFAYFTLAALYDLGRRAEADAILFPMLEEYGRCGFEGWDAHGHSNDWRMWDGTAKGYEGFLSDSYYALLAVLNREGAISGNSYSPLPAVKPDSTSQRADLIGTGAFQIENLPFLRTGEQTHQFCSYDRAGDNFDWEYFPLYTDSNGECVIFDAMGPGCLYRLHMNIWAGAKNYKGIHIRFYFDNEAKPRIDMDVSTFFSTNNPLEIFQPPLAFDGRDPRTGRDRFRILYHPFLFKKRLKVALSSEPGGPPTVLEPWTGSCRKHPDGGGRHYHWYQFTYQLFTEAPPDLESWTPEISRRVMPALLKAWNVKDTHDRAIQGCRKKAATGKIKAGKTATLWKTRHAGAITALHFKIAPTNNVDALFDSWLKITFDGAARPQIEAPLGCFFGINRSNLVASYDSLLLGWSNNQANCYFPMPFWKSAAIQIENRGQSNVTVAATVDYKKGSASPYPQDHSGYLFAHYHREDPRVEGRDYAYLNLSNCSGQVVGHVDDRWGTSMEEDERTYFDGNETPWIEGDGFEDDQGMGWGLTWDPHPLTLPIFGAPSGKGGTGGLYRFLLPDMYCFSSGIKYGHQTYGPHSPSGFQGLYRVGTEESVTFWYGHLRPRLVQTDELDVGNLKSEAAHDYRAKGDVKRVKGDWWYDGEYNNVLFKTPAIADDGVSFTNYSAFVVAIPPENQGVLLRRRTDKANNRQEAWVFIDGQRVTEHPWYSVDYEKTYRGIRWYDSDFEVPAKYTKGKSKINVRIEFVNSETGRWDEYRYWICGYSNADEKAERR